MDKIIQSLVKGQSSSIMNMTLDEINCIKVVLPKS